MTFESRCIQEHEQGQLRLVVNRKVTLMPRCRGFIVLDEGNPILLSRDTTYDD